MKIESLIRWLLFQPRKVWMKFRYKRRFKCGKMCRIAPSALLRIDSSEAELIFGDRISVRDNAEIFSFGKGSVVIGDGTFVNRNTIIGAYKRVEIGRSVTIGPNVCIYDHNHAISGKEGYEAKRIVIGARVWIGANVCILKGCTIGENAIIGAGCVVTTDVPANTILVQKRSNSYIQRADSLGLLK